MDKKTLIYEMQKCAKGNGMINKTEISGYLGESPNRMYEMLAGLDCIKKERVHKYFISDVAQRILERRGN